MSKINYATTVAKQLIIEAFQMWQNNWMACSF